MQLVSLVESFLCLLFPARSSTQKVAKVSLGDLGELLRPVQVGTVTALLPYRAPLVRALILEAKFHENRRSFDLLGTVLADHILSLIEESGFDEKQYVLVPIPLSKKRFRERGYNQVEKVVRSALTLLPPCVSLSTTVLKRTRDTLPQTTLSRSKRLTNMQEAFSVTEDIDTNCTHIVVDDVITTGATMQAAIEALSAHGVTDCIGLSLAH
jgi:ComF family protein